MWISVRKHLCEKRGRLLRVLPIALQESALSQLSRPLRCHPAVITEGSRRASPGKVHRGVIWVLSWEGQAGSWDPDHLNEPWLRPGPEGGDSMLSDSGKQYPPSWLRNWRLEVQSVVQGPTEDGLPGEWEWERRWIHGTVRPARGRNDESTLASQT